MVTNDLSSGCKLRKVFQKNIVEKTDFRSKNIKKTESLKMTSKFLYKLLIRSYARFKYFTIFKSTSVNQREWEHHGKIIFSFEKIQKCNIRWSHISSSRGENWGKLKKKLSKKCDFSSKNIKKTESPKITPKVRSYEGFKHFSQTWNLTISKNTSVNQRKCEHRGKINFSREQIQKL